MKHQFTDAQRFAVWKHHGQRCYWCEEPLRLQETTVDHVVPEHLEGKPDELAKVTTLLALPEAFKINDYGNWLPAHDRCNKNKGGRNLRPCPMVSAILDKLLRDADKVAKIEKGIKDTAERIKLLRR